MKTVNGKFGSRRSVSGHARSTRTLRGQRAVGRGVTILLMSVAILWISISPRFAVAQSLKEIRVGSSNISVTNLAAYYARDRKFFEAEGFDVKMIIIKTEATLPALVAGDLDYSTLSTSSIEATLKGMPLRVIAVTSKHPLLGLVVRNGINTVAELRGKKLSVSSFGGATYGAAVYLLKNHGLRPKEDVTILAGGTNPIRKTRFDRARWTRRC